MNEFKDSLSKCSRNLNNLPNSNNLQQPIISKESDESIIKRNSMKSIEVDEIQISNQETLIKNKLTDISQKSLFLKSNNIQNIINQNKEIQYDEYQNNFQKSNDGLVVDIKVKDLRKNNFSFLKNYLKIQESCNNLQILKIKKLGSFVFKKSSIELLSEFSYANSENQVRVLFESANQNLSTQLSFANPIITFKEKLQILMELTEGIEELHSKNFVHGRISTDSIFKTQNIWKIVGLFKQNMNEINQESQNVNDTKKETVKISLALDIQDFGLLYFKLMTGINLIENSNGLSNTKKISNQRIKSLVEDFNMVLNDHLKVNKQLDRKKFKKLALEILTKTLRTDYHKRITIEIIKSKINSLLKYYKIVHN